MPYIQNTKKDQAEMLNIIGVKEIEDLYRSIPESIRFKGELNLPEGLSELEVKGQIDSMGARNRAAGQRPFFLGAGIYHHFIPSLVDHLAGRAEFVTAYTPYQPELSQGALQAFFEYQTMICMLTGLDISNASMYDGASALAEAALMAIDGTRRREVWVSRAVHPEYRTVLKTYLQHLDVQVREIPCEGGLTALDDLENNLTETSAAVLLQNPNFFGAIEDVETAASLARKHGALSIVSADPVSLSILKPPGEMGVDIAVGEGQGLGVPMSFGGPGFGFLACRMDRIRRLPGRVVGQTVDKEGRPAYVLTFQTREQHIRRERATSNICTNHALIAIRALVYLSALGRSGFEKLGKIVTAKAHGAAEKIEAVEGFSLAYNAPFFKEFTLRCPCPASKINAALLQNDIIGGYELGKDYPGMENMMLLCVTEMTGHEHVDQLVEVLRGLK